MATERITVTVQAPSPYRGDEVYLLPTLSLEGGAAVEMDFIELSGITDEHRRSHALVARWTATYVRYGVAGWNWQEPDANGEMQDAPFDVEVLLADYALSRGIAERLNALYGNGLESPLLRGQGQRPSRPKPRSRTGPTASSTSRRRAPTSKRSRSSSEPSSDGPQLKAVG